jgi:predicted acetylornithine/succinylornithine family transaminase
VKRTTQDFIDGAQRVLTHNYKQQPIVLERGQGCEVWDVDGKRYLDLTGGIAACPLGHAHPALTAAVAAQAGKLIHVSNLFYNEAQVRLAEKLCELAKDLVQPRAFFCNSGAEANEAAIKLAKRWQTVVRGKPERIEVFSFEGSFHGRSIATVALTGQEKYRAGFGPLVEWARFLPWPETAPELWGPKVLDRITTSTCAVIIEPIQAEGGIRVPPPGFLAALRKRCSDTGTVLIFDEVQTGIGRTGQWFGFQDAGVVPDVISLAKGLAGGVPIGAMVASGEVAQGFAPGAHASTFGGNPLACAAALAVIDTIEKDRLLERVRGAGERLAAGLEKLVGKQGLAVRGRGLLRGLLVDGDATPLVTRAREKGVLLSVAGGTVARFVPPFVVTDAQLDEGVAALGS